MMVNILDKLIHKTRDLLNESTEARIPDYVPYACYQDKQTILTKSGDLIQTIMIKDFDSAIASHQYESLSQSINQVITSNIDTKTMSVYIHNIRTMGNIDTFDGYYLNKFSNNLHLYCKRKNYWHDKFVNCLYISVVLRGNIPIAAGNCFIEDKIKHNSNKLGKTISCILQDLHQYNPHPLSITENTEGVFSEHLEFFHQLLFLEKDSISLPLADLSAYLYTKHVIFGHNIIEIGNVHSKKFASVLTIKGIRALPPSMLDSILQLPILFSCTQSFVFDRDKNDMEHKDYQAYLASVSKSPTINNILQDLSFNSTTEEDYGKNQISLTVYAPNPEKLDNDVMRLVNEINKVGMIAVREDINLASCFWAQLPGNHSFINRSQLAHKSVIGIMSQLHSFWAGNFSNTWGRAVTLLRNTDGNPFFFNFHSYNNDGNTAIIGEYNSKINLLSNFLISESLKYKGKVFSLSLTGVNTLFYNSICGQNIIIRENHSGFNPLLIHLSQDNIVFVNQLIVMMVNVDQLAHNENTLHMIDKVIICINEAITQCVQLPEQQRHLFGLYQIVQGLPPSTNEEVKQFILKGLYPWLWGDYTGIFDGTGALNLESYQAYNIVLENIMDLPQYVIGSFICYYLHCIKNITTQYPDTPIIIYQENIYYLLNNVYMADYFTQWLKYVKASKICVLLFLCYSLQTSCINFIKQQADTIILCKNKHSSLIYKYDFNIEEQDIRIINSGEYINDVCAIKQDGRTTTIELNITEEIMTSVLEGTSQAQSRMEYAIAQAGSLHPNHWLPVFYKMYE